MRNKKSPATQAEVLAKTATASTSSPGTAKTSFHTLQSLFDRFQLEDKGGYITQEFQDFGYRLACELNDLPHKSLYIKMAKLEDRRILEDALAFVSDATSAKSKPRLFMWKVRELKKATQSQSKKS